VVACASSEEKRALALELGADVAVDPGREDLADALVEANLGRRLDVVLEMAGGACSTRASPRWPRWAVSSSTAWPPASRPR
jgi:NADPH2:quinone reductase